MGLHDKGLIPGVDRDFVVHSSTSYTRHFSQRAQSLEYETGHSSLSSTEVKYALPSLPYISLRYGAQRPEQFYLPVLLVKYKYNF